MAGFGNPRARHGTIVVVGPTTPPFHGVAVMTERLLRCLRRHGILAAHLDTRDPRPLDSIGRFDLRNAWLGIKHPVQFAVLLLRNPRSAVYVPISQGPWGFIRDALILLFARATRRPRIVHLHGAYLASFYRGSSAAMRMLIRVSLAGVEQAWVLTEGLTDMFDGLVPPERVHVVGNAVDDPGPRDAQPEAPDAAGEPRPLRILFLSNFFPGKGWEELITAAERLVDRSPPVSPHIRMVGEVLEEARPDVMARIERLAARGLQIELLGPRVGNEKLSQYRWADVFVYPSSYRYDGQPLVLLEAMAAGLPIITSAKGGIGDTVVDGDSAVVVEPGDIDGLVRLIERAAEDRAFRRRLGDSARSRYMRRYTPERFDSRVTELLVHSGG